MQVVDLGDVQGQRVQGADEPSGSEPGRAFGVSHTTVRRYLDRFEAALLVRVMQPWHANISKRQVKSPRIYVADSGLLHTLLGLHNEEGLLSHPLVGASWEGFASWQVLQHLGARPEDAFSWRTHAGAELDLLVVRGNQRRGFEFKRTSAPRTTKSMRAAMDSLGLEALDVVVPGGRCGRWRRESGRWGSRRWRRWSGWGEGSERSREPRVLRDVVGIRRGCPRTRAHGRHSVRELVGGLRPAPSRECDVHLFGRGFHPSHLLGPSCSLGRPAGEDTDCLKTSVVDALACPHRSNRMISRAVITPGPAAFKVLRSQGRTARAPPSVAWTAS